MIARSSVTSIPLNAVTINAEPVTISGEIVIITGV